MPGKKEPCSTKVTKKHEARFNTTPANGAGAGDPDGYAAVRCQAHNQ